MSKNHQELSNYFDSNPSNNNEEINIKNVSDSSFFSTNSETNTSISDTNRFISKVFLA